MIEKSESMTDEITLSESELPQIYIRIESAYELHLKKFGVKLPKLYRTADEKEFTIDAIVLCALAKYEGKDIPKSNLTKIVRNFYPETNDVQQARHLGRQNGWNIASERRGDTRAALASNSYRLVNLTEPYPEFNGIDGPRSARGGKDFEDLKSKFDFRCATCGSLEGEANFLNSAIVTKLQPGHMDPNFALSLENMIPQCEECNRAYLDKFIFDGNGRVSDINIKSYIWHKKYKEVKAP